MTGTSRIGRILAHQNVLGTLVRRDLRVRYARSILGYVWTLIDPLAMALVFYFVFGIIFKRAQVEDLPFIVFLLCGLLPWNWFNNSINETARALYAERLLVRSTNLPRELWVVRVVISKGIEHLLSLPILFGFVAIYLAAGKLRVNWEIVFIIPALLIEFVLLVGMGLVMAPVTALVEDFQRVVRIVLRMLFYLTPIVYSTSALHKYPLLLHIMRNPLTGIAELSTGTDSSPGTPLTGTRSSLRSWSRSCGSCSGPGCSRARALRPQGDLMTGPDYAAPPVITVDDLGIEFLRGRQRKLSLREMIYRRETTHDKATFWALRNVSFKVHPGEAVGLIGGNGSGKSTLLKMIAGTLLPDEGSVTVTEGGAPSSSWTGGFMASCPAGRTSSSPVAFTV